MKKTEEKVMNKKQSQNNVKKPVKNEGKPKEKDLFKGGRINSAKKTNPNTKKDHSVDKIKNKEKKPKSGMPNFTQIHKEENKYTATEANNNDIYNPLDENNKVEEEVPLPEPKPIEEIQQHIYEQNLNENENENQNQNEDTEQNANPTTTNNKNAISVIRLQEPDLSKYNFNLYKHLKENLRNREKLCKDGITQESYYCLECKMSTCPKCPLYNVHKGHEMVNKIPYYKCDEQFIEDSFKDIDSIFSLNPSYLNVNKVKGELKMQINNQISQLINQLNETKTAKLQEVDNLFIGTENCIEKLKENEKKIKKSLKEFLSKQKAFFCVDINEGANAEQVNLEANEVLKNLQEGTAFRMIQTNKDTVNSTFLISYDLIKNTEFINKEIKDIVMDIKANTEKYLNDFTEKAKIVEEDIKKLLEPFEGQFKYQYLLSEFYQQIGNKISKYNEKFDNMKKAIFEKVNKRGGFEDIERDNKISNTQIAQRFENILNNQLIDEDEATTIRSMMTKAKKTRKYGAGASKTPSIMTSSKMRGGGTLAGGKDQNNNAIASLQKIYEDPDEIKLDQEALQEYFIFEAIDLVKKNFRPKKNNEIDELNEDFDEDVDLAKPIPGTNEMHVYDKKSKGIIKKIVKFEKKTHKYLYFLNGCRSVLIKDRLYITGGVDKENNVTKAAFVYYIKTNELKVMPDMLKPHAYHSIEFLDFYKSIAVIGGENCSSCELYDMDTGKWRELPDMKVPRAHCGIYLDKMEHVIYAFFGVLGSITQKNNYTDVLECLELRKLALGWYKIDYNNKAEMNFKSGINKLMPLNPEMVLVYGAKNMRDFAKKSAVFLIPKQEMIKIDNKIFNEIREASKKSKKLSKVLTSYA